MILWPLIAASLSYTGTFGPYWYFVRMTSDLDQLKSYISRAAKIGGAIHNGIYPKTKGTGKNQFLLVVAERGFEPLTFGL